MKTGNVLVIEYDQLPLLARELAGMIRNEIEREDNDIYLTARQLSERIPAMSEDKIKRQIRAKKYGKKMSDNGVLVARPSEVLKYNKLN
ncbi:hypothetical protein DN752_19485 [Echinicola strongylocentroti]|uniref:Uncharacterized protein n=1 Tax=Echinicola strongylocentroti TaxID=1795355 RepID=A0A2Z4INM9_9BACT|nr:hypothetical protein [Echinicola strongylocentroti]AWW32146.1 hypothetical protein DN752_19485 [Echinicola strongylocentroti]